MRATSEVYQSLLHCSKAADNMDANSSFKVVIWSLGLNIIELKSYSLSEYFVVAVVAGFQRSSSSQFHKQFD